MRSRFAPSPTGPLHLGHAFSALTAFHAVQAQKGQFFLRFDDIDQSRARSEWEEAILDDLAWLGIAWDPQVWHQAKRLERYDTALRALWAKGLLYPCTCTRADIRAAASAPQEGAPLLGPDGLIYPGTCRHDPKGPFPSDAVLRINMKKALENTHLKEISFEETGETLVKSAQEMCTSIGDVVLARRDMGASYHLSIVVDDGDQRITDVIRGEDLREATFIHVLLQRLLGLPTPKYHHHRLIRDDAGKRLAKRDDARAIRTYRDLGKTPADICGMIGL